MTAGGIAPLLTLLDTSGTASSSAPVDAAAVTAAGAVAIAIVGASWAYWQVRADRRYNRRTSALRELQNCALTVRDVKRAYGAAVQAAAAKPPAVLTPGMADASLDVEKSMPEQLRAREPEADGAAQVAMSRVDDDIVIGLYRVWATAAGRHFLDITEVTATEEEQAWVAFVDAVSDAYKSGSGKLRSGAKKRWKARLDAAKAESGPDSAGQ